MTDLGLIFGFSVIFWITIGLLALLLITIVLFYVTDSDWSGFTLVVTAIASFVMVITMICFAIPFNVKYWKYWGVSGTVTEVSNSFTTGTGDNTNTQFVVTLKDDPNAYILEDVRASTLDEKDVSMRCTIEWVPSAADRYKCAIVGVN